LFCKVKICEVSLRPFRYPPIRVARLRSKLFSGDYRHIARPIVKIHNFFNHKVIVSVFNIRCEVVQKRVNLEIHKSVIKIHLFLKTTCLLANLSVHKGCEDHARLKKHIVDIGQNGF